MKEITRESFRAALAKAVEEKGVDYVYPRNMTRAGRCQYVVDGEPACLIGYALWGFDPDIVMSMPNDSAAQIMHSLFGVEDSLLRGAANMAQAAQDSFMSWGDALRELDETLGLVTT